jgi:hypothetical protein
MKNSNSSEGTAADSTTADVTSVSRHIANTHVRCCGTLTVLKRIFASCCPIELLKIIVCTKVHQGIETALAKIVFYGKVLINHCILRPGIADGEEFYIRPARNCCLAF